MKFWSSKAQRKLKIKYILLAFVICKLQCDAFEEVRIKLEKKNKPVAASLIYSGTCSDFPHLHLPMVHFPIELHFLWNTNRHRFHMDKKNQMSNLLAIPKAPSEVKVMGGPDCSRELIIFNLILSRLTQVSQNWKSFGNLQLHSCLTRDAVFPCSST